MPSTHISEFNPGRRPCYGSRTVERGPLRRMANRLREHWLAARLVAGLAALAIAFCIAATKFDDPLRTPSLIQTADGLVADAPANVSCRALVAAVRERRAHGAPASAPILRPEAPVETATQARTRHPSRAHNGSISPQTLLRASAPPVTLRTTIPLPTAAARIPRAYAPKPLQTGPPSALEQRA